MAAAYEGGTIEGGTIEVGTINFGGGPLTTPYLDSMILAKLTPSGSHLFSKIFKPTVAVNVDNMGSKYAIRQVVSPFEMPLVVDNVDIAIF